MYVYICLPTPYSSSSMMLPDAYPHLFSLILVYPASWHVSVPIVLLCFTRFLLPPFHPLVRVSAVVIGSSTRFRVVHSLFTYVSVCNVLQPHSFHTPQSVHYICYACVSLFTGLLSSF